MGAPFATVAELRAHWSGLPPDREAEAAEKLREASIEIRGAFRGIDARILSGDLDPDAVVLVACRMVKRAMDVAEELANVANQNQQAGPFGLTTTFRNTDGNLYLSKQDRRLLAPLSGVPFSFLPY